MPNAPLIDLTTLDLGRVIADREEIYRHLPHRHEFMQLDAIVHLDEAGGIGVARRVVRSDEFWVPGHIPGRPLMPGVLMIETAAQLAAYLAATVGRIPGFLGFVGVDGVKFRGTVSPPAVMYVVMRLVDMRPRRVIADTQAFVGERMVFEGRITGMPI